VAYRDLGLDRLRNNYALAASYGAVCLAFFLVLGGYALVKLNFMTQDGFYALFGLTVPFVFSVFRNQGWDRAIGELSYPMYLFHFALVPLVRTHMPAKFAAGTMTLALTVALSLLYLVTIHRPIETWRKGLTRRTFAAVGLAAA
jgi:peptidoglycan/LPS O-acetylase OafA/YrhL